MGWLFYTDRRVKTYADEKAEIERLCTLVTETRRTELLKACKVGSTWYAAASPANSPLGGRAGDREDPLTPFRFALYAWRKVKNWVETAGGRKE